MSNHFLNYQKPVHPESYLCLNYLHFSFVT